MSVSSVSGMLLIYYRLLCFLVLALADDHIAPGWCWPSAATERDCEECRCREILGPISQWQDITLHELTLRTENNRYSPVLDSMKRLCGKGLIQCLQRDLPVMPFASCPCFWICYEELLFFSCKLRLKYFQVVLVPGRKTFTLLAWINSAWLFLMEGNENMLQWLSNTWVCSVFTSIPHSPAVHKL